VEEPIVVIERDARVGVVLMNRPKQLNALSGELMSALVAASMDPLVVWVGHLRGMTTPTAIETPVAAACSGLSCIQPVAVWNDFTAESNVRVQLAPKLKTFETRSAVVPTLPLTSSIISPAFLPASFAASPAFAPASAATSRSGSLASQAFFAVSPAVFSVSSAALTACLPTSDFSASALIFSAPFCAVSTTTRALSPIFSFRLSCLSISSNFSLASRCHFSKRSL